MLDDDDLDFFALLWTPTGWISALIGIAILIALFVVVSGNHEECAAKHCAHGSPILAHHECLCVERPIDVDGGQ